MFARMTFTMALGIGLTVAFVTTVVAIVVGFVAQLDLSVPGVIEISSTTAGAPSTEVFFNPLAPMLMALLVALLMWAMARLHARRQRPVARRQRHLAP